MSFPNKRLEAKGKGLKYNKGKSSYMGDLLNMDDFILGLCIHITGLLLIDIFDMHTFPIESLLAILVIFFLMYQCIKKDDEE